jgi:predicted CXXCH cytochrome family protein
MEKIMARRRWLFVIGLGVLPLLLGMASQQPAPGSHQNDAAKPQAKVTNPHGPLSIPCQNCHTYTSWKPIRAIPEFNHDATGYPLRGMHQKVGCTQCHTSLVFKNVSSHCADCHADIHRRQFGANCESCHTVKGWNVSLDAIKNHQNRFPLVGAHAVVECDACHKNAAAGQFQGLSTACYSCHQKDFLTPVLDHVALGFPTTCESCHSMNSWFDARFDHLKVTGFALTGMHATLPCTSCHINNVFAGTPANCYACHTTDFQGTNNPPHAQLGLPHDCGTCHTTTDWLNAKFDHTLYAHYPLTGMHATVQCAQCHTNNNYTSTPTACYACHQADFTGATNPNHVASGFPTDCSLCHTTSGWSPSSFNHTAVFPLTGAHATVPCAQCHTNNNYSTLPTNCYGCHQADFNGTTNPNHIAAAFPTTCDTCHSTTNWTNVTFNHTVYANYPLTGMHATLTCAQCHTNNNYTSTPTACYSCHQADFTGTTNPNHVASGFPTDCSVCHTTSGWSPSTFDHSTGAFPLTGAHLTVPCAQCHVNGNYTTVPTDCYSCHTADYTGTNAPPHATVGFPTTCATCHNTSSWTAATFNHNNTSFPLTGAHVTVACAQCHTNNNYTTLPTACYGCHQADFTGTTNPNHVVAGFPTDCTLCHSTTTWTTSTFNHATVFPLTGAHATLSCVQCHANNNYTTVPTDCYSCHKADYAGTNSPPHAIVGFPTTCSTCHSTTDWTGATFNHNTTSFPLTGAHVTVACAQCHTNNNYTTLPTACYGCHQADFTGTTSPAHVAAGFPTDCTLCHSTTSWTTSTFNHASVFPLTGAHATVACAQCHTNNNYTTLPTTCYGCHQADFTGTNNPSHVAASFPTTCDTCHTTANWTSVTFNHAVYANYPLTGAHATLTCIQCHTNNNYTATSTACYSCHQTDFTGTTSPNHVTSGFPTDCSICHSTSNWTSSTFNHSTGAFPLTGAHLTVPCAQCHTNNNYTTVPTVCYSCHQADWNGTTNPAHAAAGFPTTCDTCHTTTSWAGATFNHNNTPFPLTGAHTTVACTSCHINNVFAGTPTDCYSCHKTDYTGTTNPNHVTANWPTTCATCHTTTAWLPATLAASYHTFFPINHGNSNGVCTTCHTNSSDYSVFTCTGCHTAAATNPKHNGVSGYVYNSTNCYACHKNGGD